MDADAASRGPGRPRKPIDDAVADAVLDQLTSTRTGGIAVHELARAVGVHRATLYRRWPTQDALLDHVLARISARIAAEFSTPAPSPAQLLDRVVVLLDGTEGRALLRALILLRSARHAGGAGDAAPAVPALLDLVVGAVIHRRFVIGLPCDAPWRTGILAALQPASG